MDFIYVALVAAFREAIVLMARGGDALQGAGRERADDSPDPMPRA
jgi:hypothetical protein